MDMLYLHSEKTKQLAALYEFEGDIEFAIVLFKKAADLYEKSGYPL